MTVFPLFENIDGKTFLIIGGGNTAARKVGRLLQFTNRIIVVAEETDITGVKVIRRPFEESDLERADFVIAATDDRALNRRIAAACRERRIPINVVDDPELCSFIFPSVVKRGDLTVGISTSGTSPAYASLLRRTLEKNLPDHIGGILERMGALRRTVTALIPDQKRRAQCYKAVLSELLVRDNNVSDEEINEIVETYQYNCE
ncbi:MAG: bifunctional precorrin-2 dehydrogenase/sirohydrochlorin ferrochelatase [Eubacteriales bacterium]|jgi:precorrin-2 dehydrogenase/sirohydrochlorin ferrochelatase